MNSPIQNHLDDQEHQNKILILLDLNHSLKYQQQKWQMLNKIILEAIRIFVTVFYATNVLSQFDKFQLSDSKKFKCSLL